MEPVHAAEIQRESLDATIARLAATRYGLFSREDAERAGATRHMIQTRLRSGRWEQPHPGVYRIAGVPVSFRQLLLAACMWIPGAVASYFAAGALYHIDRIKPGALWITVPRGMRRPHPTIVIREADLAPIDRAERYGIPVTAPGRLMLDLASVLGEDALEEAIDCALREGIVTLTQLKDRLGELAARGRAGTQALRATLAERDPSDPAFGSRFERLFLRLIRNAGDISDPVRQFVVHDDRGIPIAKPDFAWPDKKVGVEADSWKHHAGRRAWELDMDKRDRLMLRGWRILHLTWRQLKRRPDEVVARMRRALG